MTSLKSLFAVGLLAASMVVLWNCGGDTAGESRDGAPPKGKSKGGGPPAGMQGGNPGSGDAAAVPVEVAAVTRRAISSYLETNGTLEAENEVDIVARVAGPIVELATEEGKIVKKGQLLARIDERETKAQVEVARVALAEATRAHERAKEARESEIISEEVYDQALAKMESAQAQLAERSDQPRVHEDHRPLRRYHHRADGEVRRQRHTQSEALSCLGFRSAALPYPSSRKRSFPV